LDCSDYTCTYQNHANTGKGHWGSPKRLYRYNDGNSTSQVKVGDEVYFTQMRDLYDMWDSNWSINCSTSSCGGVWKNANLPYPKWKICDENGVCKDDTKLTTFYNRENGYCVTANGIDQNNGVTRSTNPQANKSHVECLEWCEGQKGLTGCEFIQNQSNAGCYSHTASVDHGNSAVNHYCWIRKQFSIFDNRQNGYCVTANGSDQNSGVTRSTDSQANTSATECLIRAICSDTISIFTIIK
jgi:hypothetical protein